MSEQPYWKEPIAEGSFMIGRRNPDSILQCNTYLRSFERSGKSPITWCIDLNRCLQNSVQRSPR